MLVLSEEMEKKMGKLLNYQGKENTTMRDLAMQSTGCAKQRAHELFTAELSKKREGNQTVFEDLADCK